MPNARVTFAHGVRTKARSAPCPKKCVAVKDRGSAVLVQVGATSATAVCGKRPDDSLFADVCNVEAPHLEQCTGRSNNGLALLRRRAPAAARKLCCRNTSRKMGHRAYHLHPQSPVLHSLRFGQGSSEAGNIVHCPDLNTAFWGMNADDAWDLFLEYAELEEQAFEKSGPRK